MHYKSTFFESFLGKWLTTCKTIIKCINCKQPIRVPTDKGILKVTCPKCNWVFRYSPHLLFKKCGGFCLLLIFGISTGASIAYLNHFYDITGFYLFFIIPVGAIVVGLAANIGFVAALAFLRTRGINYPMLFLVVMSGIIALFTFWLSQYIIYSKETITVNYLSRTHPPELQHIETEVKQLEDTLLNLHSLLKTSSNELQSIKSIINQMERDMERGFTVNQEKYEKLISQYNNLVSNYNTNVEKDQKLRNSYDTKLIEVNALIEKFNRGEIGENTTKIREEPISKNYAFIDYIKKSYEKRSFSMFGLATSSLDIEMGSFGLILLLLKQIGLFFALPALWWWARRQ